MRARSSMVAAALLTTVLPLAAQTGTASAGTAALTISVADPTVTLKETFTVQGSNGCPSSPYTVTFAYVNRGGAAATVQETGTTDAEGAFTEQVTVPESATPKQPADVRATVSCTEPEPAERTSNTVAITIEVATGVLTIDKTQGRAGTVVNVSGTNCLGDDVVVVFGDERGASRVAVTLRPDDTFSGAYTIPNVAPGQYFFAAACPGTDYADRAFTVLATPGVTPSPLPTRVRRPVTYTG